ncbi:hypothetical protein D9M68_674030 [compost metagenome]
MALAGVAHQAGIGHDDRIGTQFRRGVDGAVPLRHRAHLREGVDREQHFGAAGVGFGDARADVGLGEVQAAKVARIGGIAQAQVDRVGAVLQRHAQRRQRAGGRDQLGPAWRAGRRDGGRIRASKGSCHGVGKQDKDSG